jgi:hypothetical protein
MVALIRTRVHGGRDLGMTAEPVAVERGLLTASAEAWNWLSGGLA